MLEPAIFTEFQSAFGPFDLDCCANVDGSNSHLQSFCSKDDSFLDKRVSGLRLWMNPPFRQAGAFIRHYLDEKARDPSTSLVLVLPLQPSAKWWHLTASFLPVASYPAGSQLFTVPDRKGVVHGVGKGARKRLRPCHFPVVVFWDPPAREGLGSVEHISNAQVASVAHSKGVARDLHMILDSGASRHMTHNKAVLTELVDISKCPAAIPRHVRIGDGKLLPVKAVGTLHGMTKVGASTQSLTLSSVLFVPGLHFSLASVKAFGANGIETKFGAESGVLTDKTSSVIGVASTLQEPRSRSGVTGEMGSNENVYTLVIRPIVKRQPHGRLVPGSAATACATDNQLQEQAGDHPNSPGASVQRASVVPGASEVSRDARLWHDRLGHLSYGGLQNITRMVRGLPVTSQTFSKARLSGHVCPGCVLAKQTRVPRVTHDVSDGSAKHRLDRLHMDLCGPMQVPAVISGSLYYLAVVDEASRYSVVRTMTSKDQAAKHVKEIIAEWETQLGLRTKKIRSDRGGEFLTNDLGEWLSAKGIIHEKTPAYSPESNGMAERVNRTLMEKVRSLLFSAGMPACFWAEALVHCNLLRNVSPVASSSCTPCETFLGVVPDISSLRVFGSVAWVHNPSQQTRKLDPRCTRGVLLGSSRHGYRVFTGGKQIWIGSDVTIDETMHGWPLPAYTLDPEYMPDTSVVTLEQQVVESQEPSQDEELPVDTGLDLLDSDSDDDSVNHDNVSEPGGGAVSAGGANMQIAPNVGVEGAVVEPLPSAQSQSEAPAHSVAQQGDVTLEALPESPESEPFVPRRSARIAAQQAASGHVAGAGGVAEPSTLKQAMASPQWAQWREAMQREHEAIEALGTWELMERPQAAKVLSCSWVFKLKTNADGSIERFKARF